MTTTLERLRIHREHAEIAGLIFNDGDYYLDHICTGTAASATVPGTQVITNDVPLIIATSLVDRFFAEGGKQAAGLITLYLFYYRQARKQHTNQPWATNRFASQNTNIGISKVKELKGKLIEMGLVENIRKPRKDGKTDHWYVKVNFLWKKTTSMDFIPVVSTATSMKSPPVANPYSNALSVKRSNALSEKKIKINTGNSLSNRDTTQETTPEARTSPVEISCKPVDSIPAKQPVKARVLQSYDDYLKSMKKVMYAFAIPEPEIITIAETDRVFFQRKGYPVVDWDGQLEFWYSKLHIAGSKTFRGPYRDLVRMWAIYCSGWMTVLQELPRKEEFSKVTQQQVKELWKRIDKDKKSYMKADVWWIFPRYVDEYIRVTDDRFLSFAGLFKPQSWYKFRGGGEVVVM